MAQAASSDDADTLWSMIKDIQFAMMTTADGEGNLHARPMATLSHAGFEDGCLWFFTREPSGKTAELAGEHRLNLAYADPRHQTYVSIAGRGSVVREPARIGALWQEIMTTWFPNGPEDPDLALIRVDVDSAAYWDAPSSAMVHAYGYVKAKLTGQPPDPGEHGRVSFTGGAAQSRPSA